uniref:Uncharacterized protein n=1 Tax=Nelumbo nucifera TaxID=4432 RepID=A0A822ZJW8_NELNU|nr:TPA_asm: hypothetical protein HUJ06_002131 [Nelumbo nucifera]
MGDGHVDQANVNARLNVNVVWSIQSAPNRFVRTRTGRDKKGLNPLFDFLFPWRAPSTEPLLHRRRQSEPVFFFSSSLLLLLFFSSSLHSYSSLLLRQVAPVVGPATTASSSSSSSSPVVGPI